MFVPDPPFARKVEILERGSTSAKHDVHVELNGFVEDQMTVHQRYGEFLALESRIVAILRTIILGLFQQESEITANVLERLEAQLGGTYIADLINIGGCVYVEIDGRDLEFVPEGHTIERQVVEQTGQHDASENREMMTVNE